MDLRKITDNFSVSPQIAPGDLPAIRDAGFSAILCNRPDAEEAGQPEAAAIEAAAREAGLAFRWVPIVSGHVTDADFAAFDAALAELPAPVVAYCRSGTRCATMWSIGQIGQRPDDEIVTAVAGAGYDVRGVVAQMSGQR